MSAHPGTVPALAAGVRLQRDAARGGWVLLGPERVLQPDETTAAVLARIDGRSSLADITRSLGEAFEGAEAEIAGDVAELLEALAAHGWVELR